MIVMKKVVAVVVTQVRIVVKWVETVNRMMVNTLIDKSSNI
jgi:hypothetical protein